jgi:hypothetical protein
MANLDLTAMLAAQTQGRFFGPQAPEAYDKPTNIVVAGNGIFRVVKTPVALFKAKISDIPAGSRIPGLQDMQEGPELLIPKIPLKYLIMVLTFYKDVYAKDKTEASALFFWNHNEEELPKVYTDNTEVKGLIEDGQLIIYCPQQKNSGSLSEFGEDGMVNYLREHCTPLCETHSHHTMDAFWSGTDNANENMTQFYGVWGKILNDEPKFLFRWVCGDKKIDIDPSVLFDIPQIEIKTTVTTTVPVEGFEPTVEEKVEYKAFKGPWQRIEAPEDWMGQHRKSWTGYTYKGGKTGGTQTPSGGGRAYDYGYDEYYDGYGAYGYGGYRTGGGHTDKDSTYDAVSKAAKKNLGTESEVSDETRTSVDLFIDKAMAEDKSVADIEETVRVLVEELIDLGYDHIISDTIQENSGYGHYINTRYDY